MTNDYSGLYDYFMQQFEDYALNAPEMKTQISPIPVATPKDNEPKDLLSRLAKMNEKRNKQGGLLDMMGYTDGQIGRQGGLIDQYNTGSGLFKLFGGFGG